MASMRKEKLGLTMLLAGLLATAAVFAGLYEYQRSSRGEQTRVQGVALARLLSSMTLHQVAPDDSGRSALDLLQSMHTDGGFAYAQVLDAVGVPMREVAAPGVIVPGAEPLATAPTQWFGERSLVDDKGRRLREFFAPLLDGAERVASVRVGYYVPGPALMLRNASAVGIVALPVLVLALLLYALVRREMRPLRGLREALEINVAAHRVQAVELTASGEVGEFIRCFNQFAEEARRRLDDQSQESDRQRASAKVLSYHKARIESVLESMPEAVVVMDESGVVTYASRKLSAVVGIDAEGLVGHGPRDWCEEDELRDFLLSCSARVVRSNEAAQLQFSPTALAERRLLVSAYPLFSPRGGNEIYGTLVAFQDITQEALARQARRDFVAHLSHELKTPLQIIGMYAETLLDADTVSREVQIEAGNVIHDEVERVNALINNLLSIARIETGATSLNRKRVRPGDLVSDAVDSVSRSAPEGMRFRVELGPDTSAINVDKDLLRVAINNLLSNAVKYNREGGEVVTGVDEDDERIRIYVRDTGIGIAAEDQVAIFQKFVRIESAETADAVGHGLGLALGRDIVELHHGRLLVESTPGEGSEFSIVLPKTSSLLSEAA